jgi:hypothetical protein
MTNFTFMKNRYSGSAGRHVEVSNGLPLNTVIHTPAAGSESHEPVFFPHPVLLHQEDGPGAILNIERLSLFVTDTEGVVPVGDYGAAGSPKVYIYLRFWCQK